MDRYAQSITVCIGDHIALKMISARSESDVKVDSG
jgi:hypothetical protein